MGGRPGGVATASASQAANSSGRSRRGRVSPLSWSRRNPSSSPSQAGAAYLVYLGATSLWAAWRGATPTDTVAGTDGTPSPAPGRALRQGFLSNLGNPKMVVFFSSLLPQFVPAAGPTFLPMLGLGWSSARSPWSGCPATRGWSRERAPSCAGRGSAGRSMRSPAPSRRIRSAGRGGAGLTVSPSAAATKVAHRRRDIPLTDRLEAVDRTRDVRVRAVLAELPLPLDAVDEDSTPTIALSWPAM